MWWRRSWFSLKGTIGIQGQERGALLRHSAPQHQPTDPCTTLACIRVVQDNLSTHTPGALYEAFPAPEAHRILERLEFHYTPKHASWLNMVESEIGVLKGQCLDRRIDHPEELAREIAAWERRRTREMDVHDREGARQNGPRLPETGRQAQPARQSVIITVSRN